MDELEAIVPNTIDEYESNSTVRRAVERLVQVVAGCAGDLLLTAEGRTGGDAPGDIFEGLHSSGLIDDGLRRRFAYEYSGLRNRIVHDYDELDSAAVWQAARQLVPDGHALLAALVARLGP